MNNIHFIIHFVSLFVGILQALWTRNIPCQYTEHHKQGIPENVNAYAYSMSIHKASQTRNSRQRHCIGTRRNIPYKLHYYTQFLIPQELFQWASVSLKQKKKNSRHTKTHDELNIEINTQIEILFCAELAYNYINRASSRPTPS